MNATLRLPCSPHAAGIVIAATLAAAGLARSQTPAGFRIDLDFGGGLFSPSNPTVTVKVSGYFSPSDYALAGARLDILCSDVGGTWSSPRILPPLTTGSNPGVITGTNVLGAVGGQLNLPVLIPADPRNPVGLWEAEWTCHDFFVRAIDFSTWTHRFDVYPDRNSPSSTGRLNGFMEGFARIVIPAPGTTGVLVTGCLLATRRRLG